MAKHLDVSPNELRRATLMALLVYGHIEISKDSDSRLRTLMGLVDLGELKMTESHGVAAGVMHYRFELTDRGTVRAKKVATL